MKKKPKHLGTILEAEYSCRYFDVVWLWLVLDWIDDLILNISISSCLTAAPGHNNHIQALVDHGCPHVSICQQELICCSSQVRPNDRQVRPVTEHCGWHHRYCMAHLSRRELQCCLLKTVEVKVSSVQWRSSRAESRSQLWNSHHRHHTLRRASDLLGGS